jgi:hypothetical protein
MTKSFPHKPKIESILLMWEMREVQFEVWCWWKMSWKKWAKFCCFVVDLTRLWQHPRNWCCGWKKKWKNFEKFKKVASYVLSNLAAFCSSKRFSVIIINIFELTPIFRDGEFSCVPTKTHDSTQWKWNCSQSEHLLILFLSETKNFNRWNFMELSCWHWFVGRSWDWLELIQISTN